MKILIADGSSTVTERLADLISDIPSVELLAPTTTSQATLESVQTHDPEVLVMDAGLCDGPGTGLLQAVRTAKPAAVVIILSNLFFPQYRKHFESAGADLFMDKSNQFLQLFQLVRELVRRSGPGGAEETGGDLRQHVARSRLKAGLQVCLVVFSMSLLVVP